MSLLTWLAPKLKPKEAPVADAHQYVHPTAPPPLKVPAPAPVPAAVQPTAHTGVIGNIVTFIFKTWFTKSVTPSSAAK